ncbi:MAG: type II toxin-antitoxin system VapC family toxin [Candidatus Hydrothermarchaeales archaeon]
MPVIELDLLIAFVNASDRQHLVADRAFRKIMVGKIKDASTASSAYLEYELVHRSLGYPVEDTRREISGFKNFPNLGEEPLTAKVILEAMRLRETVKDMTYFDSMHASTAMLGDGEIISTDPIYDKVDGLNRIDPSKI